MIRTKKRLDADVLKILFASSSFCFFVSYRGICRKQCLGKSIPVSILHTVRLKNGIRGDADGCDRHSQHSRLFSGQLEGKRSAAHYRLVWKLFVCHTNCPPGALRPVEKCFLLPSAFLSSVIQPVDSLWLGLVRAHFDYYRMFISFVCCLPILAEHIIAWKINKPEVIWRRIVVKHLITVPKWIGQ